MLEVMRKSGDTKEPKDNFQRRALATENEPARIQVENACPPRTQCERFRNIIFLSTSVINSIAKRIRFVRLRIGKTSI